MSAASIYRSARGQAEVIALYEKKLASLAVETHSRMVETRFGHTHVLAAGPQEAPPVMVLTGISTGAPRILERFLPLSKDFRLYAPDPIGQPGRSAQTRVPPGDHNYGKWMVDVLNGLGLEQLPFIGVSFGGGILLDTASYAPERISRAALIAPAGLTRVPFLSSAVKFFIPCLLYRYFPSRERLIGAVQPLAGEIDDYSLQVFDATLRNVKLNVAPPGPFDKKTLAGFKAPTLLLLAESDIFIPVESARRRARELLPSLTAVEVSEGPHIPAPPTWKHHAERIGTFLKETR
ncbi:MAG: alpha/beta hydrolase [Syntrophobacterales bacterium]|jgi:pimeloyl-ACP methyl ester carboxylesterase|nr:alpha/beta hydrolase [Syntrophobacterales bacterium]